MFISILLSEKSFLFSNLKFKRIVLLIFMNYETVINLQNTAMTIFFLFQFLASDIKGTQIIKKFHCQNKSETVTIKINRKWRELRNLKLTTFSTQIYSSEARKIISQYWKQDAQHTFHFMYLLFEFAFIETICSFYFFQVYNRISYRLRLVGIKFLNIKGFDCSIQDKNIETH